MLYLISYYMQSCAKANYLPKPMDDALYVYLTACYGYFLLASHCKSSEKLFMPAASIAHPADIRNNTWPPSNYCMQTIGLVVQKRRRSWLARHIADVVLIGKSVESRGRASSISSHAFEEEPVTHIKQTAEGAILGNAVNAIT